MDVDLLLVEPNAPEAAVAIEIKRIRVHARTFAGGIPNKLQEYEKAVQQANRLARVGFAQVYLYVFVVVDSTTNISSSGCSSVNRASCRALRRW
jgi:hypothetical protein